METHTRVRIPVLLVGSYGSASHGVRGVGQELAERLVRADWPVFITSDKPGRLPRLLDMVGSVRRRHREYAVAQVEVYSGLAFLAAELVCWALRRTGKPYVLTLHGGNLPAFARRWPGRVRRLLQSAAMVTVPSRYLREQMGAYHDDLRVLPNALELSEYRFRLREHPQPYLIWLRSFHEIYNPSLAPKVLARLTPWFPRAQLTMVGRDKGDGSQQRALQTAAALGVTRQVLLPGGVPKAQVPTWLNSGDIFLNTTNVDNTPVSILEAMAGGLCVVSTTVGGLPYLLEDGHDALLVPPDDPEAMVAAVRRILTEPGLAAHLSRNARASVEAYDWSVVLPRWEAILTAVAEGRKP